MDLFLFFLIPLGWTILLECGVAVLYGIRTRQDLFVVVLTQILTNPVVNYGVLFLYGVNPLYYGIYVFVVETIVLFVEAQVYKHCLQNETISPFRLSALCNLTSFGFGVVMGLIR